MDLAALFEKSKNGNKEASSEIYNLYFSPISKYIYYRTKSVSDTRDIIQIVFSKFYSNINEYTANENPFKHFYTITKNSIADWQKKKKPYRPDEIDKNTDFMTQKILKTLKLLPLAQQESIVLKAIQGYTNEEIGDIIGETDVSKLQNKGIQKIKTYMKSYKKKR